VKTKTKKILMFSGVLAAMAFSLLFMLIFYMAYFGGNFAIILYINKLGEAHFEFVFFGVLTIIIIIGCMLVLKHLW